MLLITSYPHCSDKMDATPSFPLQNKIMSGVILYTIICKIYYSVISYLYLYAT